MRFVKKNRIIHLQIQQGKLLSQGRIDNARLEWIETPNFNVSDTGIKNGVDFHEFSYSKRAIDFDDLRASDEYVITGLKFKAAGSHLNLEATARKIDFKTGQIFEPTVKIPDNEMINSYENR